MHLSKLFIATVIMAMISSPCRADRLDELKSMISKTKSDHGIHITLKRDKESEPMVVVGGYLPAGQKFIETSGYALSETKGFVYSHNDNTLWIAEYKTPYTDLLNDENYEATGLEVSIGHSVRSAEIRNGLVNKDAPQETTHNMVDLVTQKATAGKKSLLNPYLNISASKHKFEDNKDRNRHVIAVTSGVTYDVNSETAVSAAAFAKMDKARDSVYDHQSLGAQTSLFHRVNDSFVGNIGYQFTQKDYSAVEDEQESVLALSTSWNMTDTGSNDLFLNLQYQYVRCDKNLSSQDYARQIGLMTISKQW